LQGEQLLQVLDWDIELRGIDYALTLELHPCAVSTLAREVHVELHFGTAIGDEWVRVDQIVTRNEHMTLCADILFDSVGRLQMEERHSLRARDRCSGSVVSETCRFSVCFVE
jgi:hypothetical protein